MTTEELPAIPLEDALIETIANENALDLLSDLGEVGIDRLLMEGPLQDVPILGSIVKTAKLGIAFRDRAFAKKVLRFLFQLRSIPHAEREAFAEKMADADLRERVGEQLILSLDRLDDAEKANLLGLVFRAYVHERISYQEFTRLAAGIDRARFSDLVAIRDGAEVNEESGSMLAGAGLMVGSAMGEMVVSRIAYHNGPTAELLKKIWREMEAEVAL